MAEPRVYLKCSARQRTFSNGGSVINVGVKVSEIVAFAKAHGNQGGYLNLVIQERREPGPYGDTHSVVLDTFVPTSRRGSAAGAEDDIPF